MTEVSTHEHVDVTPAQAAAWVATASPGYFLARFSAVKVAGLAGQMVAGHWGADPEYIDAAPIIIGADGRLAGGLSRLLAVISSKRTVRFRVVQGGPSFDETWEGRNA